MTEIEPESKLLFRPDAFFLKSWRGWGVVRNARGLTVDRYEGHGRGSVGSRSATAEQVFTFESGRVSEVQWDILSDDENHYLARDLKSGLEARGRAVGDDFCWDFEVPGPGPFGRILRARTRVVYSMATAKAAFSFAETRRSGLLATIHTTFYQQD